MKRLRTYELYTSAPGGRISNAGRDYHSGMWVVQVRARSIRQAYALLARQVVSAGMTEGVVAIDNSQPRYVGGHVHWPWHMPQAVVGRGAYRVEKAA